MRCAQHSASQHAPSLPVTRACKCRLIYISSTAQDSLTHAVAENS